MCCWRVFLWQLVVVVVSRRVALVAVVPLLVPALLVVHRHRLKPQLQQKPHQPKLQRLLRQRQRKPLQLHRLKQHQQKLLQLHRLRQHQQKPHQRHLLKKQSLSSDPGSLSSVTLLLLRGSLSTLSITLAGVHTRGRFFVYDQPTVCPGQCVGTPRCTARRFLRAISLRTCGELF